MLSTEAARVIMDRLILIVVLIGAFSTMIAIVLTNRPKGPNP